MLQKKNSNSYEFRIFTEKKIYIDLFLLLKKAWMGLHFYEQKKITSSF